MELNLMSSLHISRIWQKWPIQVTRPTQLITGKRLLLFVLNSSDRKRLESTFYENIEKCVTDFHGLSTIIIEEA